ncbi:hypothetical protein Fcan01_15964 [Folsomia candida]|uniref:Uncharacterized protein n=1 Tax=Folsomia candida TaxID=158441 RepID=A0A226DVD6_FOLCA|nr:hypothetical protein Fcan01_15964 [Folsomia candida]
MFPVSVNNWIPDKFTVTHFLVPVTLALSVYLTLWSSTQIKDAFMVSLQLCGTSHTPGMCDELIYISLLQWIAKNPNCAGFQTHALISKKVPLPEDGSEPSRKEALYTLLDQLRCSSCSGNFKYYFLTTIGFGSTSSFLYKNARVEITRRFDGHQELITLSTPGISWNLLESCLTPRNYPGMQPHPEKGGRL